MRIAGIGAGNVGKALASRWKESGHQVIIGVRAPGDPRYNSLRAAGLKLSSVADAVGPSEVVVLAIPFTAAKDVVKGLGDSGSRILVDCTNALEGPAGFSSTAEAIRSWSGSTKVIKAFNTTGAGNMRNPKYGELKADMFICGDDQRAKESVIQLARDIGFDAVDVGGLDKAKLLDSLAILWIDLAFEKKLGRDIAWKLLRR